MFSKEYFLKYLTFGLIAAVAFAIPALFYLRTPEFRDTWLLFLGNALFCAVICVFILLFNKRKNENESTQNTNAAGHIVTFFGVVIAAVLSLIMLVLFVPEVFNAGTPETVMEDSPTTMTDGKTDGLVFMLFMNAVVGNFAFGSFAAIILPYTAKRNQKKDRHSEVLNN